MTSYLLLSVVHFSHSPHLPVDHGLPFGSDRFLDGFHSCYLGVFQFSSKVFYPTCRCHSEDMHVIGIYTYRIVKLIRKLTNRDMKMKNKKKIYIETQISITLLVLISVAWLIAMVFVSDFEIRFILAGFAVTTLSLIFLAKEMIEI